MIVWADGAARPEAEVRIGLLDRGFTLGDAVFETLLVENGRARRTRDHLHRLGEAGAALGIPVPSGLDGAWVETIAAQLAAANGLASARAALRLTVTRGEGPRGLTPPTHAHPRAFASLTPAPAAAGPATLREVTGVRRGQGPSTRYKTGSYIDNVAARIEAGSADEALILTLDGMVSGAAAANLFWITDGVLCTPDVSCAIREGVVRAAVLAAAQSMALEVRTGRFCHSALQAAEAAAISSALIGLRPVQRIDFAEGDARAYAADDRRLAALAQRAATTRVD